MYINIFGEKKIERKKNLYRYIYLKSIICNFNAYIEWIEIERKRERGELENKNKKK